MQLNLRTPPSLKPGESEHSSAKDLNSNRDPRQQLRFTDVGAEKSECVQVQLL